MRTKQMILALLGLCALAAAALLLAPRSGAAAEIYMDGHLLRTVDLDAVEEPYEIAIGAGNTALVERGRIRMLRADCPDKLCVRRGWTASPAKPLVCLPNRVLIVVGGAAADVDAVTA